MSKEDSFKERAIRSAVHNYCLSWLAHQRDDLVKDLYMMVDTDGTTVEGHHVISQDDNLSLATMQSVVDDTISTYVFVYVRGSRGYTAVFTSTAFLTLTERPGD